MGSYKNITDHAGLPVRRCLAGGSVCPRQWGLRALPSSSIFSTASTSWCQSEAVSSPSSTKSNSSPCSIPWTFPFNKQVTRQITLKNQTQQLRAFLCQKAKLQRQQKAPADQAE